MYRDTCWPWRAGLTLPSRKGEGSSNSIDAFNVRSDAAAVPTLVEFGVEVPA